MNKCYLCPRNCGVDREISLGFCGRNNKITVARAALHLWEEPPVSGKEGSGTIFFTGCSLRCSFCQNHDISLSSNSGKELDIYELNELFYRLIDEGANNINLVTPSHYVDKIAEAIRLNKPKVPIIYNCGGYEKVDSLKLLEGLVDVYLPDFKYAEEDLAQKLSFAKDYPDIALEAIKEMRRQQPQNIYNDNLIKNGVIIRHLILPLHTKNSMKVLDIIKENFPHTPVSLMAQYTPVRETGLKELNRKITERELDKVTDYMLSLGLDGFVQERKSAKMDFIPDFNEGILI